MGLDLTIKLRKNVCKHCKKADDEIIFEDLSVKNFTNFYTAHLGLDKNKFNGIEIELPNNYEDELIKWFAINYLAEGEVIDKLKACAYDVINENAKIILLADW